MSDIRILTEHESDRGWSYEVALLDESGSGAERSRHTLTLSFADYEHWCHGSRRPEQVAQAVMAFVAGRRDADTIPDRFDAATVRRWYRELDRDLARLL